MFHFKYAKYGFSLQHLGGDSLMIEGIRINLRARDKYFSSRWFWIWERDGTKDIYKIID